MGALSTAFTSAGQPALLFLVGAVSLSERGTNGSSADTPSLQAIIAVMPLFLIPLRRV